MIKNTKEYGLFKFRPDNREKISQSHVDRLKNSIQTRNLLHLKPIIVNKDYEVLDGQHRLLAAKSLGVEIYYEMKADLQVDDIITLNISKSWGSSDYLNFHCQHGNQNYIKLKEFLGKSRLSLKVALTMFYGCQQGRNNTNYHLFKIGKFIYKEEKEVQNTQIIWDSIGKISQIKGHCQYANSAKFWKAMVWLVSYDTFDEKKWILNLERMIEKVGPRATARDYMKLFAEIYNWRNLDKIPMEDTDI